MQGLLLTGPNPSSFCTKSCIKDGRGGIAPVAAKGLLLHTGAPKCLGYKNLLRFLAGESVQTKKPYIGRLGTIGNHGMQIPTNCVYCPTIQPLVRL